MPLRFCKGIQWTVTDLVWDRSGIGYEERRLCTGANTDEGCGTRPLNNTHTYIQPWADQELSSLTSLLWSSEKERDKMRETDRKSEEEFMKVLTLSHCGCPSCLTEEWWSLENTMVLSSVYTWPELEHIQYCESLLPSSSVHFLSSLSFLPMGVSSELPYSAGALCCTSSNLRVLAAAASSIKTLTCTPRNPLSNTMLRLIKWTTVVFGCKDFASPKLLWG